MGQKTHYIFAATNHIYESIRDGRKESIAVVLDNTKYREGHTLIVYPHDSKKEGPCKDAAGLMQTLSYVLYSNGHCELGWGDAPCR